MITNRQVWLEKKVGREEFHRVPSMEAVQWVLCQGSLGNASCFNCLLEIHLVHWFIKESERSIIKNWLKSA